MRKVVYSSVTKLVAVLLLIAFIVVGVLFTTAGIYEYFHSEEEIYSFEDDFSESWYVRSLLDTPQNLMYNVYHDVFYEYDEYGHRVIRENVSTDELRAELIKRMEEIFGEPGNFEKINYFVQWNDLVFTNCGAEKEADLLQGEYHSYFKRDKIGNVEHFTSATTDLTRGYLLEEIELFDSQSEIVISCSIRDDVVQHYKAMWELQESIVLNTFIKLVVCVGAPLLLLIYLLCVCGKNKDGEYKNNWLDNIWIEVHLALIAGAAIGAIVLCIFVIEDYVYGNFPHNLICWVMGSVSAVGSLIIITSLLSIIRNIKTRRLIETSIVLRVIRWGFRLVGKIVRWSWRTSKSFWTTIYRLLSKKTGVILISMLFGYTAFIGILGILTPESPMPVIIGVMLFGFSAFFVARRSGDLDEIKKGVSEVRNGNVAYKIPELRCEDMKALAANINDIAMGLDASVAAQVKAERLKTELITNVSHDIKTPITSIINYTALLSKVEGLPEEAKDYVAVIAKKSDRLKNLTQDLFDISKVQSGNDEVVLEKLDVALLVGQALGEHDNEIQSSNLQFCVNTSKELFISADGRKMSRVLSNLISNILKYTMKNTRVFITASEKDGMIVMEFKNISAYPLDFDVEEITQRFVRGDESRTAEGNGLGLAIAKSYTEICNGTFEIVVDGDMFKAIIKFRKYA
ncbi:MAG: HAMP domain-containing histidine kinase [Oscillospiraceae bacterium]|nr:HAMP domain-containing histidine kinase [Oscillospiraceae bacterium]